jgi:hypothetical protein
MPTITALTDPGHLLDTLDPDAIRRELATLDSRARGERHRDPAKAAKGGPNAAE